MFGKLFKQEKKGNTAKSQKNSVSRRRSAPTARPHPQSIQKRNSQVTTKPSTFQCFFDKCKRSFDTERGVQLHVEEHLNTEPSKNQTTAVKPEGATSSNMFAGLSLGQAERKESSSAPPTSSFGFIKPVAKPSQPVAQKAPSTDLFSGLCFSQPSNAPSPPVTDKPSSQSVFGFIAEPSESASVQEVAPPGASVFSFVQPPASASKSFEVDTEPRSSQKEVKTDVFSDLMAKRVEPATQAEPVVGMTVELTAEGDNKDLEPWVESKSPAFTNENTIEKSTQNLVSETDPRLPLFQALDEEKLKSSAKEQKTQADNLDFSSKVCRLTSDVEQCIEKYWSSLDSLGAENASREKEKTLTQSMKNEIQTRDNTKRAQEAAINVEEYEEAERMNSVISLCERNIQRYEEALVRLKRERVTSLSTDIQRNEMVTAKAKEGVSNVRSLQDEHNSVLNKFVTVTAKELGESERDITAKMDRVQRILTISTEDLDTIEREEKEIESQIIHATKDTNEKKNLLIDSRSALEAEIEELYRQIKEKQAEAQKLTDSIAEVDEEVSKVRLRYESQLKAVDDRKQRVLAEREEHIKDKTTLDVRIEDLNLKKAQADEHESKLKNELDNVEKTCNNLQDAITRLELQKNRIAGRKDLQIGDDKISELGERVSRLKKSIAEVEMDFEEKKGKQADIDKAKATIVAQIPVLQSQKKAAVSRRAYGDAGRINNDIKTLNSKLQSFKSVQEDLEDSITAQEKELTSLRLQLKNTKEELNSITSSADLQFYNIFRQYKWEIQDLLQNNGEMPETERRVHEAELKSYIFEITEICSRYDWDPEASREQKVPGKVDEEEQPKTQPLIEPANSLEPGAPLSSQKQEQSPEKVKERLILLKEKLVTASQQIDKAVEEERYDDAENHQRELEETEAAILILEGSKKIESEDRVEGEEVKVGKEVIMEDEGVVQDNLVARTITSEAPNKPHSDFKSNIAPTESKSDDVEGKPNAEKNKFLPLGKSSGVESVKTNPPAATNTTNQDRNHDEQSSSKAEVSGNVVDDKQESGIIGVNSLEQDNSFAGVPVEGLFAGLNV